MKGTGGEVAGARLLLLCDAPERAARLTELLAAAGDQPGIRGGSWTILHGDDPSDAGANLAGVDVLLVDHADPLGALDAIPGSRPPTAAVLRAGQDAERIAARVDELLPEAELSPLLLDRTLRLCDTGRAFARRIEAVAQRDVLTGLPSRRLFERQLELALLGAERHDRRLAVGCLSLDDFDVLAAGLGQARTEALLVAVADRLGTSLRRSDLLARAHADDFLLLLELPGEASDLASTAEKLLAAVAEPILLDGIEARTRASLGVALFPDRGRHAAELLDEARGALAEVRRAGGDDFRYRGSASEIVTRARGRLEAALPGAIERGEFSVRYQPRLELASMRITGAEVLARWHSPEFGDVSPERFIPVAEQTGAIERVDAWVLRSALADLRRWQDAGHRLQLGVNVSADQFRRGNFAARIRRELRTAGIAPDALELEITERVFVANVTEHIDLFDELSDLGIGFAVDDFGIGYSSLAYLKHFPVHALKIDRTFVTPLPDSPEDAAIVRAIIALGHALDLRVVAEGVETDAQLEFLQRAGCDEIQGFLISPGSTAERFERLLSTGITLPRRSIGQERAGTEGAA